MYSNGTMTWKEKERSRIRAVQMDSLRGLLDGRKMDKVPNALIRELSGVIEVMGKRNDEGIFRWLCHVRRTENDIIAKKLYMGECGGSHSAGRMWKR